MQARSGDGASPRGSDASRAVRPGCPVSSQRGSGGKSQLPKPAREQPAAPERKDLAPRTEWSEDSSQAGGRFDPSAAADDRARDVPGAARLVDEPGQPLDDQVGSRIGAAYGRDFSHVRVHSETPGAAIASQRSAVAVTVGRHVAFAPGEYRPGTAVGDTLIAHELGHVVQQEDAAAIADAPTHGALEADTDSAATSAVLASQGHKTLGWLPTLAPVSRCRAAVQRERPSRRRSRRRTMNAPPRCSPPRPTTARS